MKKKIKKKHEHMFVADIVVFKCECGEKIAARASKYLKKAVLLNKITT